MQQHSPTTTIAQHSQTSQPLNHTDPVYLPARAQIIEAFEEASSDFFAEIQQWLNNDVDTRTMLLHNQQIGALVREQVYAHH